MTATQLEAIERHGRQLLAIFPNATERDPVKLCKKLRRLETQAAALALRGCNGPEWPSEEAQEADYSKVLGMVNAVMGNVHEYQPKTGAKCGCKRGQQRDNCPACEGTGYQINFRAIRERKPLVPVFINRDPRGYALKIDDSWMREHGNALNHPSDSPTAVCRLHRDWGGYGILAPEIGKDGAA